MKVYCKECGYFRGVDLETGERCIAPNNFIDSYYEKNSYTNLCPFSKNKQNDCKDFIPRKWEDEPFTYKLFRFFIRGNHV